MVHYVRDIMTSSPVTVEPREPVIEVARLMRDQDVGAVLVTDHDRLRGLVTDRDLVVRALADGTDLEHMTVGRTVSEDVVTVGPDEEIGDAAGLMRDHGVRRLPVVDAHGTPVGVVTLTDLQTAQHTQPDHAPTVAPTPST
ncbi:CBS domain-containing protein [Streptomyces sp. NPDC001984]